MSAAMLTATLCGLLGGVPAWSWPFSHDEDDDEGVIHYDGAIPYPVDFYGCGVGFGAYYPYDAYETWVHGYYVELPVYGGYAFFRPYNWRDVQAHSSLAYMWGLNPATPYSHEYFLRSPQQRPVPPTPVAPPGHSPASYSPQPSSVPYGVVPAQASMPASGRQGRPAAPSPTDGELQTLREIIERQAAQIDRLQRRR